MSAAFSAASRIGRRIPLGMGDIRFAAFIHRYAKPPVPSIRVLRGGANVFLEPFEWPQAQAWILGGYDPTTVQFVLDRLPVSGGVFFDVGAHVGLISCQVGAQRPSARIYGFEPHPRVAPSYRRNVSLNGIDATLIEAAASDHAGHLAFSLDRHAIGEGDVTVPTLRLDDYIAEQCIDRIDVMKLDVEGHELKALEGASRSLAAGLIRAVIIEAMEVHGDTLAPSALLREHGYKRVRQTASPVVSLRRKMGLAPAEANAAYVL